MYYSFSKFLELIHNYLNKNSYVHVPEGPDNVHQGQVMSLSGFSIQDKAAPRNDLQVCLPPLFTEIGDWYFL